MSKEGYFYYNANLTNTQTSPLVAVYSDIQPQPILGDPSEYNLSIVRFSVSGQALPLFVFQPSTYIVKLQYLGYQSSDLSGTIAYTPSDTSLTTTDPTYYYVYDYQSFIYMINNALKSAFTNLSATLAGASVPLPSTQTEEPYFYYDSNTQLIQLNGDIDSYNATSPYALYPAGGCDAIEVWCNRALSKFLTAFQCQFISGNPPSIYTQTNYQKFIMSGSGQVPIPNIYNINRVAWDSTTSYSIGDIVEFDNGFYVSLTNTNVNHIPSSTLGVNWDPYSPAEGFTNKQQYVNLYTWNQAQSIVFTSNTIPVASEQLPPLQDEKGSGSPNYRKILSDFLLSEDSGPEIRSSIVYNPTAEYRRISLVSHSPLFNIQIQVFWTDVLGNFYPIYLGQNQQVTCKILFEKKDIKETDDDC